MIFNFTFTFPEDNTLNDIVVSVDETAIENNILSFYGPTFYKPKNEKGFLGWKIEKVESDLILLYSDTILTKNNLISFNVPSLDKNNYSTTIYCKMKWQPQISVNLTWDNFEVDPYQIMTINFDLSNGLVLKGTYANDAVNMAAGSDDWDKFFGHYPVLVKDGVETVRLDPNDYSRDINGNVVDIESGEAGDVMIAFPRRGLKISKNDNILTISFTSSANNKNYNYYAHKHINNLNTFYIGAYNGYIDKNGKLRSLSGKRPTTERTISEFRQSAQFNGEGYEQLAFYQLTYIQAMYAMKYKNLDARSTIGSGITQSADFIVNTGTMNKQGLDYGDLNTYGSGTKFAGIEHLWGCCALFIDGIVSDKNYNYLMTTESFNNNGNNYEFKFSVGTSFSGLAKNCIGTSEGGFAITETAPGGTNNIYFGGSAIFSNSKIATLAGGGIYSLNFVVDSTYSSNYYNGRLIKI